MHVDDLLVQIAHGKKGALAELCDLLAPLLLALLGSHEGSVERAHGASADAFARIRRTAPPTNPATTGWTGSSIERPILTLPGGRRDGLGPEASAGSRHMGAGPRRSR